jgi:hypothetical protein
MGVVMSQHQTQASIFAAEHAKTAALESLENNRRNARNAETVTKIALGVSMPHQIAFILGLIPLHFPTTGGAASIMIGWLESFTLIAGALGIPVAVDYLILICIRTMAAVAASRTAKRTAFSVILFPVSVSGAVNVLAPGPVLLRVLFGVVVVLIPLSQAVRVASQNPDFRKIEAMELQIQQQVSTPTEDNVPSQGVTRQGTPTQQARRRAANARRLFAANPGLTVAELAAAAGVGRNTAKRIIDTHATSTIAEMEEELAE